MTTTYADITVIIIPIIIIPTIVALIRKKSHCFRRNRIAPDPDQDLAQSQHNSEAMFSVTNV